MMHRMLNPLSLIVAAFVLALLGMAQPAMAQSDDAATEDVVVMLDGRELHGQILEENRDTIVFEFVDRDLGLSTKLTLQRDDIAKIERDVPIAAADQEEEKSEGRGARIAGDGDEAEEERRHWGVLEVASDDPSVPLIYIVPMEGQMGTDAHVDVYEEIAEDIREVDPDLVLVVIECRMAGGTMYDFVPRNEEGLPLFDMYREMINVFHDDLREYKQAVWIKQSEGVSSLVALSWDDIYMAPGAHFGGVQALSSRFLVADPEVRAKFREAFMSQMKGMAEYGSQPLELVDALIRAEYKVSARWKGREVEWLLDDTGEYVVDNSDKRTVNFTAKSAADFSISKGTAETLDDLALIMGIREYRVERDRGQEIYDDYKEDWRRAYDQCVEWWEESNKFMNWATGADALMYLGRVKSNYERIQAAMNRYGAVELRLQMEYGISKLGLQLQIELLRERIRGLRGGGGGGIGGGGSGGGGASPGGR